MSLIQVLLLFPIQVISTFSCAAGVGVCDLLDPVHRDGHLGHTGQGRGSEDPRSSPGNGQVEIRHELDLQSAGSSPNLTYTKLSALDAISIP